MKNFSLKKGFTLVELMIVIAIIGILAVVLYPSVTGYFSRARDANKKAELQQLNTAVIARFYDYGSFFIEGTGYTYHDRDGNLIITGKGYMNFKHPGNNPNRAYKKSITEGLEEWWYIGKNKIPTQTKSKWLSGPYPKNAPCNTQIHEIDLYMYYFDDVNARYSVSTSLEHPKQEDIDHIQTLYNGMWRNGICERYGKNYGIGN